MAGYTLFQMWLPDWSGTWKIDLPSWLDGRTFTYPITCSQNGCMQTFNYSFALVRHIESMHEHIAGVNNNNGNPMDDNGLYPRHWSCRSRWKKCQMKCRNMLTNVKLQIHWDQRQDCTKLGWYTVPYWICCSDSIPPSATVSLFPYSIPEMSRPMATIQYYKHS